MWFIPTKREVQREFEKIRLSFKKRDVAISKLQEDFNRHTDIIAKLQTSILLIESKKSEPNRTELLRTEPNLNPYEKEIVKKVMKSRPEAIKNAIRGLIEQDMTTTQMFHKIVEDKHLISKTQFYHYLHLVRTELRTELRTNNRIELRTEQINKK